MLYRSRMTDEMVQEVSSKLGLDRLLEYSRCMERMKLDPLLCLASHLHRRVHIGEGLGSRAL